MVSALEDISPVRQSPLRVLAELTALPNGAALPRSRTPGPAYQRHHLTPAHIQPTLTRLSVLPNCAHREACRLSTDPTSSDLSLALELLEGLELRTNGLQNVGDWIAGVRHDTVISDVTHYFRYS